MSVQQEILRYLLQQLWENNRYICLNKFNTTLTNNSLLDQLRIALNIHGFKGSIVHTIENNFNYFHYIESIN